MTATMQTITHATPYEGRIGDHLIRESIRTEDGVTHTIRREGIAHHRDRFGNWRTAERGWLTDGQGEGQGVTLTIHRPVRDLPTEGGAVIVPAEGHEYITATVGGETYRAREAVLVGESDWYAAWRSDGCVMPSVTPGQIDLDTWKVDDR